MSIDLPKGIGDMIDFRLIYRVKGQSKLFSPKIDKNKSGIIPMFEYLNEKNKIVVPFKDLVCIGNYVKGVSMAEMFNSLNNEFIDEDANTKNNPLSSFNLKAYQKEQIIKSALKLLSLLLFHICFVDQLIIKKKNSNLLCRSMC